MADLNIAPIGTIVNQSQLSQKADADKSQPKVSFGDWLNQSIAKVDGIQKEADNAAMELVKGENKDIHGTMIAMQKASIATDLMLQMRNKIISAYDEIKRMSF